LSAQASLRLSKKNKFFDANAALWCGQRNNITVLDLDTTDERVWQRIIDLAGNTPLKARSKSGNLHLWYRHNGEKRAIRCLADFPLDILGSGICVVPPSSVPDGSYTFLEGNPALVGSLPVISEGFLPDKNYLADVAATSSETPIKEQRSLQALLEAGVPEGERANTLFRLALREARSALDEDELLNVLGTWNRNAFMPPLPEAELRRHVSRAWREYQQKGRNWVGGSSRAIISKEVRLKIEQEARPSDDASHAMHLLIFLKQAHGWREGGSFILSTLGISVSLGWTKSRLRKARDLLERSGLITCHIRGRQGSRVLPIYSLTRKGAKEI